MRSFRRWLLHALAAVSLLSGVAQAQTFSHSAYLDLDNNPATGCAVTTAAGAVSGIEARLMASVTGQPPMVTAVTREACIGAGFGPPVVQAAGYPVGLNIGTAGADVVEFATPLSGLGNGGPARIVFVSSSASGADQVTANGVILQGTTATGFSTPAIIPATGLLTLLVLVGLVLWLVRKHPGFGSSVALLLLLGVGVVWAANFVTDGAISDWIGVSPRVIDATNDSTSSEGTIDLVAVFAETEAGSLFLRADVRNAENAPPVAAAQAVTVAEDGNITITLTGSDPEAAALVFAISAPAPTRGTLGAITPINATSASVIYTPNANQNGADSFGFTVSDGTSTSLPAIVSITITAINDAPVVAAQALPVVENSANGSVVGTATATDVDTGQTLTWAITGGNALGAFAINPATGQITVADAADVTPANSPFVLTVQATDNDAAPLSGSNTITVTVTGVNDEPSFTAGANQTVNEDAGAQTGVPNPWATAISAGPPDESGQTLTFIVTNDNNALFSAQPQISPTGVLTYTPAANGNGIATVIVTLMDNGGTAGGGDNTSPTQTFTITVTAINDVPVFTAGPTVNVLQDAGPQTVNPWATGLSAGPANESAQTLTFAVSANTNAALFSAQPTVAADGTLTFTPTVGIVGTANITLTLADSGGTANGGVDTSGPQTFTINVNNVNDPPTFTPPADPVAVLEDAAPVSIPAFITGIDDGDPPVTQIVSFNITGNTNAALFSAGPAIASNGTLSYTLAPNANGTADITFEAMDDGGTASGGDDTSAPDTFTISVTPVNDVPSFTAGANQGVLQDAGAQTVNPWATALSTGPSDESAQTLSFNVTVNTNAALFSAGPAISPTGVLTYTPTAGTVGSATITLNVQDTGGVLNGGIDTSATQTFTITVNNINDAPTFTVPASAPASLEDAGAQSVLAFATAINDGDPPVTQGLTFIVTGNTNAALFSAAPAINATTGDLTYTAVGNASGSANITVVLMDDGGTGFGGVDTSALQTFAINVTSVNDTPSFTVGPDQSVLENAGPQTANPWATGLSTGPADEVGQTLSFNISANTNAALFSAGPSLSPTGVLTYTTTADASGSATITLNIQDNGGTLNGGVDTSATQTFIINVANVNAAPSFTVGPDQTVNEDVGAQTVNPWATAINDNDPGVVQAFTFNVTGNTNPGLFSAGPAISATGVLTYAPTANVSGSATITITLSDDGGIANGGADTSAPQMFLITVNAVNDAPSFTAGPNQTVNEDVGPQTVSPWATALSTGPADEAGQTLSFNVTANDNAALFSAGPSVSSTGVLTYTPADNTSGTATITLNIQDNGGTAFGGVDTSATQQFTITVIGVNDVPSFAVGPNQTVLEDAAAQTVNPWATAISDGDPDAVQTLTFQITANDNPTLFSAAPAVSSTGVLTFTPALNQFGVANLSVRVMDNGGTTNGGVDTSATQNFTITVTPVNDAPTATVKSHTTHSAIEFEIVAASHTGELLEGAADVDDPVGDLTAVFVAGSALPAGAQVTVTNASDGSFRYDPPGGASGAGSFQFQICDDGVPTAPAQCSAATTVTFTITGPDLYFIDDGAAAGGDGGLNDPFDALADLPGARGNNDRIFAFAGAYPTAVHSFLQGEHLIGQGSTGSFDTVLGVVAVANGTLDTRPSLTGLLADRAALDRVVVVPADVVLRGVSLSGTSSNAIFTNGATNLTVADSHINGALGPALQSTTANAAGVVFSSTTVTGGANGISLNAVTGTFSFGTGALSGQTGVAFLGTGTLGTTTFGGSITKTTAGNLIELNGVAAATDTGSVTLSGALSCTGSCTGIDVVNRDTGTITFSSASQTLNTGANAAVTLDNNDTATINFTGGALNIDTTSGAGLNALNGASAISVTGANNTIDSTTGTALSVVASAIGSSGLTFRSINANGGANGIVLDSTCGGVACSTAVGIGGLNVTGDGANTTLGGNGTGGTLSNMAGADGATSGTAIRLNNTRDVVLRRINVTGVNQNYGIRGYGVHNFTLEYCTVGAPNPANAADVAANLQGTAASLLAPENAGEGSIYFGNFAAGQLGLTGTGTITSCEISAGRADNMRVLNSGGTLNRLTITGSTFGLNHATSGNSALTVEGRRPTSGTTVLNSTVTGNTFTGSPGNAANFTGQEPTAALGVSMDSIFQNNTVTNNHAMNIIGGGNLTVAGFSNNTFNASSNPMRDAHGSAITLQLGAPIAGSGVATSLVGRVENDTIGVTGVANSGSFSGNGIFFSFADNVTAPKGVVTLAVNNNQIRRYSGNAAIFADNTGGNYDVNVTFNGNLGAEGGVGTCCGLAMAAGAPASTDDIDVCSHVGGAGAQQNDFSLGDPTDSNDVLLGVSGGNSSMRLPGYVPDGTPNVTDVQTFVDNNNVNPPATATVVYDDLSATAASYTGGAACPTPP